MNRYSLVFLCMILLSGCMRYTDVEFKGIQDAQIKRLDAKGLSATVTVQVHNPNSYRITISDPDMDLFLNDVAVGKATLDSAVTLEAGSDRNYALSLRAIWAKDQSGLLPVLMASALTGTVKLGVKGTVVGKAGLIRKRVPFEAEQRVKLER